MHPVANIEDIPEGGSRAVSMSDGRTIALFKLRGKVYALEDRCPHAGASLSEGELDGECVVCPRHEWYFDLKSGACKNVPGWDALTLKVEVREGKVYLR